MSVGLGRRGMECEGRNGGWVCEWGGGIGWRGSGGEKEGTKGEQDLAEEILILPLLPL